jgi:azurin
MKIIKISIVALLFAFTSCGGGEKKEAETKDTTTAKTETSATPGEANITINVTGNSMADMAYDPMSFTVKAGDKVKLTLINKNSAEGMLHNWVLVKLGTGQEVATAGIAAGTAKNYIPENPNIIAASGLAKPNETVTLDFTAPTAGSYNYICTYPGHFPTMIGKLIVE